MKRRKKTTAGEDRKAGRGDAAARLWVTLLLQGSLFLLLLLPAALLIEASFPFPELSTLRSSCAEGGIDTLYLGDSVVFTTAPDDVDPRTLGQMVADDSAREVIVIAHGSYTALMFEEFISHLERTQCLPEAIIIGINPRSFSPNLYARPIFSFGHERAYLRDGPPGGLSHRLENLFLLTPERTAEREEAFLSMPVMFGDTPNGTVRDHFIWLDGTEPDFEEQLAGWYIYIYGLSIEEDHPVLESLRGIRSVVERSGTRAIFYITPIDHEDATAHVPEIGPIIARNIAFLRSQLEGERTVFLDLSATVGHDGFLYRAMPDEHLREASRRELAEEIAAALAELPE